MSCRRRNGNVAVVILVGFVLCVPALILGMSRIIQGIGFNQDVSGRLKRAADANSIETAKEELTAALDGMKYRGCTTGRSHAIYYTPSCDVGFWHDNIQSALDELNEVPADADPLTTSNQLMKLRETILDEGGGISVTLPPNIVVYPNQTLWFLGWTVFVSAGVVGVFMMAIGCGVFD